LLPNASSFLVLNGKFPALSKQPKPGLPTSAVYGTACALIAPLSL